ncbi:acyltransferase [Bowmanella denitrificans]|uniref:acyltransferase family protein n=1 Tax=Bowmanella denitrificans TaxID=366582 RepID=UPI0031CF62DF
MKDNRIFNKSIHGARGLAALLVFFSHVGAGGITENFFSDIGLGLIVAKAILLTTQYGVEVFFMISGYLITDSIIRHVDVRSFLLDRCIRLYPVFIPVVSLIFIVGPFVGYHYFEGVVFYQWIGLLVMNLLFIPGVYPIEAALVVAWSLSYEAVFYLMAAFTKKFSSARITMVIFILIVVLPFIAFYPRAIFFVIGVALYFLHQKDKLPSINSNITVLSSFFAFFAVLFCLQYTGPDLIDSLLFWFIAVLSGFIIFLTVVNESSSVRWLLHSRYIQFLGTISYSFYIWHTPVMFGTKRIFSGMSNTLGSSLSFLAFAVSSFVLALIVSYVSFLVFEDYSVKKLKGGLKNNRAAYT